MACPGWGAENTAKRRPYRWVFRAVETVCEEQQAKGFGNELGHHPPPLVQEPFPDIFS